MFRNVHLRLGIIAAITLLSVLIALPKIPININNKLLKLESSIGGYYFNLFNGKLVLDLRDIKRGLDLQGGVRIVLKADMSKINSSDRDSALESAKSVIERRVNLLGVSEPSITTAKVGSDYRIIVEIPGVKDMSAAVNLIGQTAQLQFRQLGPGVPWDSSKYQEYYMNPKVWVDSPVTGADLKGAAVVFAGQTSANSGAPEIQLQFTDSGRQKFSDLAKANVNKPVALFLDQGQFPLSMPTVSPDLATGLTGDPVITGNFDVANANALSIQIRAGALPIPVQILQQENVGATLGNDSVNKSFFAGAVGLSLVLMFLVFMYGRLGLIASAALVIYSFIVISIFKIIPVVLTLPGIAGFILSVGMATDANILIFERIKEEILWGKPRNLAISLGFERAWSSIKDSNISSLLTAGVLFYFGSGPVRGFALTLAIGVLVSMFTAIFVSRTFIEVFKFGYNVNQSKPRKWPNLFRRKGSIEENENN